jgi:uncharacterized protein (TIGR03067 family)
MVHQSILALPVILVGITSLSPLLRTMQKGQTGAKAEAVKKELKRMAGTWECVFEGMNGQKFDRPEPPPRLKKILMPKGKYRTTWLEDGTSVVPPGMPKGEPKGKRVIDPTARPKTIDYVYPPNKEGKSIVTVGIYEFENEDELHICTAAAGHPRPTDFTFDLFSGRLFQIFRRVKDEK